MDNIKCKICGKDTYQNGKYSIYTAKEMIIGSEKEFRYLECPHCKSLQLLEIPEDMGPYYNQNYYSLVNTNIIVRKVSYHLNKNFLDKDFLGQIFDKFVDGVGSTVEKGYNSIVGWFGGKTDAQNNNNNNRSNVQVIRGPQWISMV